MSDPETNYPQYLIQSALAAGVPWHRASDMTTEEVATVAQVRQGQIKELTQIAAWIAYNAAALTGVAVNAPSRFPKLEDAFPSLFERETHQDWRLMKERVEDFAQAKNKLHEEAHSAPERS